MNTGQDWKTIGPQILRVHTEECGDGSCGCGCGDIGLALVQVPERAASPRDSRESVSAPERN